MALQLPADFRFRSHGRRGPQNKYPWEGPEGWANGQPWEIHAGDDYTCTDDGMRAVVYKRGWRTKVSVTTEITEPGIIRFQFQAVAA
jgi:hypothetical protein